MRVGDGWKTKYITENLHPKRRSRVVARLPNARVGLWHVCTGLGFTAKRTRWCCCGVRCKINHPPHRWASPPHRRTFALPRRPCAQQKLPAGISRETSRDLHLWELEMVCIVFTRRHVVMIAICWSGLVFPFLLHLSMSIAARTLTCQRIAPCAARRFD